MPGRTALPPGPLGHPAEIEGLVRPPLRRFCHNGGMLESLRTWATAYGGDAFLYISFLAVVSLVALVAFKDRLSTLLLKRFIRLGALIALPLTVIAMELGENHWGVAVVAMVWAVIVAIISQNAVAARNTGSKTPK